VTLTASDLTSGIKATYYWIDAALQQVYTAPFLVGVGTHTVYHYSIDNAGNVETTGSIQVTVTDTSPPVTTATLSGTLRNGWYVTAVTVTLTALDQSGVKETKYSLDGGRWATYKAPVTVSTTGSHTIQYYSTDVLGYVETTKSIAFNIDVSPPITLCVLGGKLDKKTQTYAAPVTVTLTASDAGSGVAYTMYRIVGVSNWQTYTGTITFMTSGTHTVEYYSADLAGNIETVKTKSFTIK
jgi:hypothetical protein